MKWYEKISLAYLTTMATTFSIVYWWAILNGGTTIWLDLDWTGEKVVEIPILAAMGAITILVGLWKLIKGANEHIFRKKEGAYLK